ncbi:hypothetical protein BDW75DRAFT_68096 [Aspergillus navahoensis]
MVMSVGTVVVLIQLLTNHSPAIRLILCDQVPLNNESFNSSSILQRRGLAFVWCIPHLSPTFFPTPPRSPDFVPIHPLIPPSCSRCILPRPRPTGTTLRHCPVGHTHPRRRLYPQICPVSGR